MIVLHVLKSNIYSGAEKVACTIIEETSDQYQHIYMSKHGSVEDVLRQKKITYWNVNKVNIYWIKKAIARFKPDIIHAHDYTASVLCAVAVRGYKCVLISHLHSNPTWIKTWNVKSIAYRWAIGRIDKIISVSNAIPKEAAFRKSMCSKIYNIGNPFSVKRIWEQAQKGSDNDIMSDLLFVGRFTEEKNPIMFLNVVRKICQQKKIKAIMIGDGILYPKCKEMIDTDQELQKHVKLLGFQDNPYKYMLRTKIVCIPSKYEGFGLVAVEAMALGKVVVCSGAGGLSEIMVNLSDNCCETVERFSNRITKLLSNDGLYRCETEKCMQEVRKYDNLNVYIEQIKKIYKDD